MNGRGSTVIMVAADADCNPGIENACESTPARRSSREPPQPRLAASLRLG